MSLHGIVNPLHIAQANGVFNALKAGGALARLKEVEPALAGYIAQQQAELFQILERSGVSHTLVHEAAERLLRSTLTSVQAIRDANYMLWEETVVGARLLESVPALGDFDVLADFKSRYHQTDQTA